MPYDESPSFAIQLHVDKIKHWYLKTATTKMFHCKDYREKRRIIKAFQIFNRFSRL